MKKGPHHNDVYREKLIHERMGKDIIIEPFDPARLNPNSYNLSLANELRIYEDGVLDMKKKNRTRSIQMSG